MKKQITFIVMVSIICIIKTGCLYSENPEQEQSSREQQIREIPTDKQMEFQTVLSSAQENESKNQEKSELSSKETNNPESKKKAEETTTNMNDIVAYKSAKTVDGYQTHDGVNFPITVTMGIVDIQTGEDAYVTLLKNHTDLPKSEDGMEYIIITISVTYDKGEPDTLDMSGNEASMISERRGFSLSNGDSNAEPVTNYLSNSIYDMSIKRGESAQGAVAFMHKANSDEPLGFIGFNNIIKFDIKN